VLEEEAAPVNRSGVTEYIPTGINLGEVGGLEGMKSWLLERGKLFQLREGLTG